MTKISSELTSPSPQKVLDASPISLSTSKKPLPITHPFPTLEPLKLSSNRPTLELPETVANIDRKKSFHQSLAIFIETLSSIESTYLDTIDRRLSTVLESYRANFNKNLEAEREIKKQINTSDWHSYIQKIAACLCGAISLILGGSVLTSAATIWETLAGTAIIASGASSILGTTLSESHLHPQLAGLLTVSAGAMSLIGSTHLALHSTQLAEQLVPKIAVASMGILGNISGITKEFLDMKIRKLQASNTLVNKAFETQGECMKNMEKDLGLFSEGISDNITTCANIQRKQEQVVKKIMANAGPLSQA